MINILDAYSTHTKKIHIVENVPIYDWTKFFSKCINNMKGHTSPRFFKFARSEDEVFMWYECV